MPDHFFVVGAQRSGTTYLYRLLEAHPEIAMARPLRPEPKFFLDDGQHGRGGGWYLDTYFRHAGDAAALGEKSVGYLESERAARRIAEAHPAATIVAVLREPIARAVSHYGFSVESGVETRDIETALGGDLDLARGNAGWFEVGDTRIASDPFAYRRRGRYRDDLAVYRGLFPSEQLVVILFEDLVSSPGGAAARLYGQLGVDPGFRPRDPDVVVNPGPRPPGLSPGLLADLADYFREANRALAEEFGLDLSPWDRRRGLSGAG
ncbi:MAG TPA: sulfotransferase [Acidimicrobiia bacterium]|jgi:hypothetical protein